MRVKDLQNLLNSFDEDEEIFILDTNKNIFLPQILVRELGIQNIHEFQGELFLSYAKSASKTSKNSKKAIILAGLLDFGFPNPENSKEF